MMVKVKYVLASLFSSYLPLLQMYVGCVVLNEIIDITIGILKYLKIQDGHHNIELLQNVFKVAHIDFLK